MRSIKPWLRIGFETLAGNSGEAAETTMDFQGAGFVAEVHYGAKWFVGGGAHLGLVIVDAFHKEADTAGENVNSGIFYKNSGFFFGPYAGGGIRLKSSDLFVFIKPVLFFAVEDQKDIDAFSAIYAGVGLAWNF